MTDGVDWARLTSDGGRSGDSTGLGVVLAEEVDEATGLEGRLLKDARRREIAGDGSGDTVGEECGDLVRCGEGGTSSVDDSTLPMMALNLYDGVEVKDRV